MANPLLDVQFGGDRVENEPAGDDPTGSSPQPRMTMPGVTANACVCVALTVAAGLAGWASVDHVPAGVAEFPAWLWGAVVVAFVVAVVAAVRPRFAAPCAVVYAVAQGAVLGGVAAVFQTRFDGVVLQAIAVSIAAFLGTLLLRRAARWDSLAFVVRVALVAVLALVVVYVLTAIVNVVTPGVVYLHEARTLGIAVVLGVCALAAVNFVLDVDVVAVAADAGAPAAMAWYAAFGLTVTLVWLYVSVVRLLALLVARR